MSQESEQYREKFLEKHVVVRTKSIFCRPDGSTTEYVLEDWVDREELALVLRVRQAAARFYNMRSGEVVSDDSVISLSEDKIAAMLALTPNGYPPFHPDRSSIRLISHTFPRSFGKNK